MEKWKSRKLWVAIFTAVLVALNDQLGWGFTQESLVSFVTLAVGYILGQAHVDAKKAGNTVIQVGGGESELPKPQITQQSTK